MTEKIKKLYQEESRTRKYDIYHIEEAKLLRITSKAILIEKEDWEKKYYYIPISCLEYGLEDHYKVGDIIEFYPCEWWLTENRII